jgi:hypothetical protein
VKVEFMHIAIAMDEAEIERQCPEVGDYLQPPKALGRRRLQVRSVEHDRLTATTAGRGQVVLSTSWTELATAGFRLLRYKDVQSTRWLVLMASASIAAFAASGCWDPGVMTVAVVALSAAVAGGAIHGLQRDWRLRRAAARGR